MDLKKLFQKLARENTSSVLIEGGAAVITSALGQGLVNRLVVVTAPKILGKGIEAVGDLNIRDLTDAKILSVRKILKKGPDVIMDARLWRGRALGGLEAVERRTDDPSCVSRTFPAGIKSPNAFL